MRVAAAEQAMRVAAAERAWPGRWRRPLEGVSAGHTK
jgi:hypothetical protein